MIKLTKLILSLLLSLLLTGCSLFTHSNKLELSIHAVHYLNPDHKGQASPVVVGLYQLRSRYEFLQRPYNALNNHASKVLGNNLLDKQILEILPKGSRLITVSLPSDARFLGITAGYRNLTHANWRVLIPLKHSYWRQEVSIHLNTQSLSLQRNA